MPIGPFLEQSEQAIRSSIEVNLYGVIAGCQLALPDMIARRSGHIINIASLSGLIPVPGQVVYVGAKFGVVGLSAALADEIAPHGVEVSVVMPPFTNTELISGTKSSGAIKPVEPEDIAAAVVKTLEKPKTHVSVPTAAAVHRAGRADAGPARKALAQQAFGAGHACSWTSTSTRGRATSSARRPRRASSKDPTRARRVPSADFRDFGVRNVAAYEWLKLRPRIADAVRLDRVDLLEELVRRESNVVGGADEHEMDDLGVFGCGQPDPGHRL